MTPCVALTLSSRANGGRAAAAEPIDMNDRTSDELVGVKVNEAVFQPEKP